TISKVRFSPMHQFTLKRSDKSASLITAAHHLSADIIAEADEIESTRRIPPQLVQKFLDTGIWRMGYPPEVDMLTRLEVIEIIATADGSAGWCTMLAGGRWRRIAGNRYQRHERAHCRSQCNCRRRCPAVGAGRSM